MLALPLTSPPLFLCKVLSPVRADLHVIDIPSTRYRRGQRGPTPSTGTPPRPGRHEPTGQVTATVSIAITARDSGQEARPMSTSQGAHRRPGNKTGKPARPQPALSSPGDA